MAKTVSAALQHFRRLGSPLRLRVTKGSGGVPDHSWTLWVHRVVRRTGPRRVQRPPSPLRQDLGDFRRAPAPDRRRRDAGDLPARGPGAGRWGHPGSPASSARVGGPLSRRSRDPPTERLPGRRSPVWRPGLACDRVGADRPLPASGNDRRDPMRFARFAGLATFASLIFDAPLAANAQPALEQFRFDPPRQPHRPRGPAQGPFARGPAYVEQET